MKTRVLTALFFIALAGTVFLLLQDFREHYFTAEDLASLLLLDQTPMSGLLTEPHLEGLDGSHYQPATDLLKKIELQLFGGQAEPYMLVNLIVHLANMVLLYLTARLLFGARAALIAAILFAVHPVLPPLLGHTAKAVQKEFHLLFSLSCLFFFLRFRMRRSYVALSLSTLFMALAMGSCQWLTLPLVILLCDLFLPRNGGIPGRLKHHVPLWIAFALLVAARLTIPDELSMGSQQSSPSFDIVAHIPASFMESFTAFGIAPTVAGGALPWIAAAAALISMLFWIMQARRNYLAPLLQAALLFIIAALPAALWTHQGFESAGRYYLPVAFLCLFTGVAVSGGPRVSLGRLPEKVLVPAAMLVLAACYGFITHEITPQCLDEGKRIKEIRLQVLALTAPGLEKNEPVFLMDLPGVGSALDPLEGFSGSVGPAFLPPFTEPGIMVFPVGSDPFFDRDHHVAFMLYMWSEGVVLKYDEGLGKLRELAQEEKAPEILRNYWRNYMQGKKPSLMRLETPNTDTISRNNIRYFVLKLAPGGFPLVFPYRRAMAFRAMILTRLGPTAVVYTHVNPDFITRQNKKPYVSVQFDANRLRRALVYFNGDPAFMWVEAVDEAGKVFHRTPLVRLRIYDEE